MKIKPIGPNQTEIHGMGCEVLFSYETPVALCGPDGTWYRTEKKHSSTTSKHINKWIPNGRNNPNVVMLPQEVLDNWEAYAVFTKDDEAFWSGCAFVPPVTPEG
jgi:hypothetical protein